MNNEIEWYKEDAQIISKFLTSKRIRQVEMVEYLKPGNISERYPIKKNKIYLDRFVLIFDETSGEYKKMIDRRY